MWRVFEIFDLITQQQYRVYYRYNIRIFSHFNETITFDDGCKS